MLKQRALVWMLAPLAALLSGAAPVIQEPPAVRVPEGDGARVLTDGIFSPGEWDDALTIDLRPGIQLLLKRNAGFVFIGVRYSPFTLSVIDLFISPDGEAIHQLHVSAQMGERLLTRAPGAAEAPEFVWGATADWYANEIRWNERKLQTLVRDGQSRDEAQLASLYRYDGFEIQIRQSKFSSDEWLVRLESPASPDWAHPVVYPAGTDTESTRGWLKLMLK